MDKVTMADRFRYWFDNTMSRGPIALIGWLGLISTFMILLTSTIVWLVGIDGEGSLTEQIWAFVMLTLEPDAVTFGHWTFRIATLVIVFTSIFVLSTLIGILTTGIEAKLEDLRKGRSRVIESGHTVILGWSPQVFPILSELILANLNQVDPVIVVMGNHDKLSMQEEIKNRVGSSCNTRIVYRRGDPMEPGDLSIASLDTARSIIILAPPVEDPDPVVIKVMLAITKNPNRKDGRYHIVAEIHQARNLEVAAIVGQDEVELIQTRDLIARITAQTCRQSGLSVVYNDLLDFAGDEIYFQQEPKLTGKTFAEALLAYDDSTIIGLLSDGWVPRINPPMDRVIKEGDQVIAIAEDDDRVVLSGKVDVSISHEAIAKQERTEAAPENVLILGWNRYAGTVIRELDHYVTPGSAVAIIADVEWDEAAFLELKQHLRHIACTYSPGNTADREVLESVNFHSFDHVIVLSYSDTLDPQKADARTLVTLLHLRDIADRDALEYSIVSEMLDIQNRNLAESARPDDFIVSDRLISLMLSQISENKLLGPVLGALFDPEGSEIYLKPAEDYVDIGQVVNFYTVVESASRKGEVAIGYRLNESAFEAAEDYGVVLNPVKSAQLTFNPADKVIVLAES